MAPLHRAITIKEVNGIAMLVSHNLKKVRVHLKGGHQKFSWGKRSKEKIALLAHGIRVRARTPAPPRVAVVLCSAPTAHCHRRMR